MSQRTCRSCPAVRAGPRGAVAERARWRRCRAASQRRVASTAHATARAGCRRRVDPSPVAQLGVRNVVIPGNSRIPLNYRTLPMTDVVTSDGHEDHRDHGDRGVRNDGCAVLRSSTLHPHAPTNPRARSSRHPPFSRARRVRHRPPGASDRAAAVPRHAVPASCTRYQSDRW